MSNPPRIKIFKANIYSSSSLLTIDVIRCLIIVILLTFFVIELIEKKEQFKKDFFSTISLKMFYSLFTILIFVINFVLKLVLLTNTEEEFFDLTYSTYKAFINLNLGLSLFSWTLYSIVLLGGTRLCYNFIQNHWLPKDKWLYKAVFPNCWCWSYH